MRRLKIFYLYDNSNNYFGFIVLLQKQWMLFSGRHSIQAVENLDALAGYASISDIYFYPHHRVYTIFP